MNARNLFEIEKLHSDLNQRQKEKDRMLNEQHLNEQRMQKRMLAAAAILLLGITLMMAYTLKARRKSFAMQQRYMKMKENFFTNITHEFRTPLTLILGLSHDMAKDKKNLDDDSRKKMMTIEKQGRNLLMLINQILDISKIKSNIGNPEWTNGNVCAYVEMIVEGYKPYATNKGIALQYVEKNQMAMDFIPDYISKVMNNLLSNAMKFTPKSGKVSVITWCADNMFYLDVCDTGSGIELTPCSISSNLSISRKTERNISAPASDCHRAVRSEGSRRRNQGGEQGGICTTFHICIPVKNNVKRHFEMTAAPVIVENTESEDMTKQNADKKSGKEYTVLVVEDNRSVAQYIGELLEDRYNVLYAENGQEGLDKAKDAMPDIIMSDVMMPVMDGYEMCRRLRGDESVAHIPIVMVTAKITDEDRLCGLEAGADAYLTKPFNSSELLIRVDKLLEQRRKIASDIRPDSETEAKNEENTIGDEDRIFIAKVTDAIYAMIRQNKCADVRSISAMVCMSPSQFYRKMSDTTGLTPASFIQRVKVRKACMMLDADPTSLLTDVALRCGRRG